MAVVAHVVVVVRQDAEDAGVQAAGAVALVVVLVVVLVVALVVVGAEGHRAVEGVDADLGLDFREVEAALEVVVASEGHDHLVL